MIRDRVLALLRQVADGQLEISDALDRLARDPIESLPFATIDHHRALRQGYPEVILGQGKTTEQVVAIAERFAVALDHAAMVQAYEPDPEGAAIEFRKHLGWYVKGLPNSAELRRRLHTVNSFGEVEGIFGDYLEWLDKRSIDAPPLDDVSDNADLESAA